MKMVVITQKMMLPFTSILTKNFRKISFLTCPVRRFRPYTANATTFDGRDPASGTVKVAQVLLESGVAGGAQTGALTTNELPSHTHTENPNVIRYVGGSVMATKGTYYGYTYGSANIYTGATGAGYAHNNMPPFVVVNIWKRTA